MFNALKGAFKKAKTAFSNKLSSLISGRKALDEATITELESLLIDADTGTKAAKSIIKALREKWQTMSDEDPSVHDALAGAVRAARQPHYGRRTDRLHRRVARLEHDHPYRRVRPVGRPGRAHLQPLRAAQVERCRPGGIG